MAATRFRRRRRWTPAPSPSCRWPKRARNAGWRPTFGGALARLRSLAHHARRARSLRPRGGQCEGRAGERGGGSRRPAVDRPPDAPRAPLRLLDAALAGEETPSKLARVREALGKDRLDGALISDPHATAWLFNVRGGDVAHTPLRSPGLLCGGGGGRSSSSPPPSSPVRSALSCRTWRMCAMRTIWRRRSPISPPAAPCGSIRRRQPVHLAEVVERAGGKVAKGADPVAALKARKNAAEIAGMRAAHLRDGVALTRFLHWFDGAAASGTLTEIDAVEALETFRRETGQLRMCPSPLFPGRGRTAPSFITASHAPPTGRSSPASSSCSIPARNIPTARGCDAHAGGGHADGGYARAFHACAQGPYRPLPRPLPEGHHGGAARYAGASVPVGRAGLDFEHGTGHGVGAGLSCMRGRRASPSSATWRWRRG